MADADATELQGDGKALGGNARKKRGEEEEEEEEERKLKEALASPPTSYDGPYEVRSQS